MSRVSKLQASLAIPPLPVYFISVALLFGFLSWFIRAYLGADSSYTFNDAAVAGLVFGAVMTLSVRIARWRLNRNMGKPASPRQQLRLNQAVYRVQIPQDAELRYMLPRYIKHYTRINRHSRIYVPLFFGAMTILSVYLSRSMNTNLWLLYAVLFVLLGIVGVIGTNRYLQRLQLLQAKLSAQEAYVSFRRIAPIGHASALQRSRLPHHPVSVLR